MRSQAGCRSRGLPGRDRTHSHTLCRSTWTSHCASFMGVWGWRHLQYGSPLHRAVTPTFANQWGLALSVAPAPSSTRGAFLLRVVIPPAIPAGLQNPGSLPGNQAEASTGFVITASRLEPCYCPVRADVAFSECSVGSVKTRWLGGQWAHPVLWHTSHCALPSVLAIPVPVTAASRTEYDGTSEPYVKTQDGECNE